MPTYYHGGTPGLPVGEQLRPPTETNIVSSSWALSTAEYEEADLDQRRDKVYLTTDPSIARFFATVWRDPGTHEKGGGAVYEVEVPDAGTLEADPDLASYGCWQANSAVIVRVHEVSVPYDQKLVNNQTALVLAKQEKDRQDQRSRVAAVLNFDGIKGLV